MLNQLPGVAHNGVVFPARSIQWIGPRRRRCSAPADTPAFRRPTRQTVRLPVRVFDVTPFEHGRRLPS